MANVAEPNAGSTAPHGSNTPADGKEEAGAPSKPFYRRILENYLSSTQTKDKPSETPAENVTTASNATNPAEAVFPLTQEKIAKMQRELLDAAYYAEIDAEAEKAIKDPSRKLIWNPNITPEDGKWLEQREKFRALLVNNSVANILESEFEDAQKLLLIPPPENGPMLQIQLENAREYKAVFKPGARFHGVADNLATKLTMLKFGLPVEAVTLKNVERCDNTLDEDDPQDGPEDTPAVQRIMYAEMPLEFLDLYSERSFGYPMLRSKSQCAVVLLVNGLIKQCPNVTISNSQSSFLEMILEKVISQILLSSINITTTTLARYFPYHRSCICEAEQGPLKNCS